MKKNVLELVFTATIIELRMNIAARINSWQIKYEGKLYTASLRLCTSAVEKFTAEAH